MDEAQKKFMDLMREIKSEKDKIHFLKWISSNWGLDNLQDEDSGKKILNVIAEELRAMVPFNAILPSENISLPSHGPNSDCQSKTTLHIDEFLYDDEYINKLVDDGQLSRYYCEKCFSQDVKLLTFISHSMSINGIHYIFKCLLKPLETETILDVGSRLGPVLYGAYLYTLCPKIIGVEINQEFCQLQLSIIKKFHFNDRIQVVCNNIFNELDLLSSADVIVLNNVFEFFSDFNTVITSWNILSKTIKPECIIVTIPPLEETFQHFKVDFDWRDWVKELEPYNKNYLGDEEELENFSKNIKHYKVKKKFDSF